jgi:cytidylate kinase
MGAVVDCVVDTGEHGNRDQYDRGDTKNPLQRADDAIALR